MKQKAMAAILAAMLLCAAGCKGGSPETPSPAAEASGAQGSAESVLISAEGSSAEEKEDPEVQVPEKEWDGSLDTEEAVFEYLAGEWRLCPAGKIGNDPSAPLLTFEAEAEGPGRVTVSGSETGERLSAPFTLEAAFENLGGNDRIRIDARGISGVFAESEEPAEEGLCDLQLMTARVDGKDVLALRETGEGSSLLILAGLDREDTNEGGLWVFERIAPDPAELPDPGDEEELLRKDEEFYAFCWLDLGDRCCLQAVDVEEYEEEGADGTVIPAARCARKAGPETLYTRWYEVTDGAPDPEEADSPRAYCPGLVRVTTDENGAIRLLEQLGLLGEGVYLQKAMDGAGPDYRDPEYFKETDQYYLGVWTCDSPRAQITVSEASPQTGGYEIQVRIGSVDAAQAYANVDDGALSVNQGYIMEKHEFRGTLERTSAGVRFTVTESEFSPLAPGTTWDLTR